MADVLRIKRRTTGLPGAPSGLANAEIAYNEVDHTLYYGEGTGGTGGSATTVVPIGGSGMASNATPAMDSTSGNAGSSSLWSRGDHRHPTDTSRAPIDSPIFTGNPQAPTPPAGDSDTSIATTAFVKTLGYGVIIADTPPSATVTGQLWFDSVNAQLYVWYDDGTSLQWVIATAVNVPQPAVVNPLMDGTAAIGSGLTYARVDHVHPIDTSRYAATNPAGYQTAPQVVANSLSAFQVPTGDISWNSQKITALHDPTNPQDAATKQYVDNSATGLISKVAAQVASAGANLGLSGLAAIDGYTPLAGDRVLVKDQTLPAKNGIYVAALSTWARAFDMDTWAEVPGAYVFVVNGTVNANSSWTCNSPVSGVLETTAITWVQFSQAASILAGDGLTKTGNQIDAVGTAGRIAMFANNIDIDSTYVGQTSIITLGSVTTGTWNATAVAVNHGGTGAVTLTGYVKGAGTVALTGTATIPNTDITGLGTMSTQNATNVAISGGVINVPTLTVTGTASLQTATAITMGTLDSSTNVATTAFVKALGYTTSVGTLTGVTAGSGLTGGGVSGTVTLNAIGTAARILVNADNIDIDAAYVGQTSIITLGAVTTGTWNATTIAVNRGGSGATTLTGYLKGTGTTPFTASATIPNTDIAGLGTMSTQNANAVNITGGTIDGVTFDCGAF